MRPVVHEFLLQDIYDRTLELHHQVVPVVAIFTADIHAADECIFLIDNRGLDMVAGHPRVNCLAHDYP